MNWFFIFLLVISSCKPKTNVKLTNASDTEAIVITHPYDTLIFAKSRLDSIIDLFPALPAKNPLHPDSIYLEIEKSQIVNQFVIESKSEVGHDYFNILYAHLQKPNNNFQFADTLRRQLTAAAHLLRNVFLSVNGFGTYYTHQHRRIYGYVEYWLSNFPNNKSYLMRGNTVEKNKFITSLKAYVTDAISPNNNFIGYREKHKKILELFQTLKQLSALLNDAYVLQCIKNYRESNYPATFIP